MHFEVIHHLVFALLKVDRNLVFDQCLHLLSWKKMSIVLWRLALKQSTEWAYIYRVKRCQYSQNSWHTDDNREWTFILNSQSNTKMQNYCSVKWQHRSWQLWRSFRSKPLLGKNVRSLSRLYEWLHIKSGCTIETIKNSKNVLTEAVVLVVFQNVLISVIWKYKKWLTWQKSVEFLTFFNWCDHQKKSKTIL